MLTECENGNWNADEFVGTANKCLPEVLPEDSETELNLRLVRHYASAGMLDEPSKSGKEARYSYRHLLQLLLVRKMLSQGYGSAAIGDFPRKQDNPRLFQLVTGQLELTVQSNPALDFLENLRQKAARPSPPAVAASQWTRICPLPGLEIQLRDDFRAPAGPLADQTLELFRKILRGEKVC